MSEQPSAVETWERPEAASCRHHWVIESPQGATSVGVCKYCGAQREFYNSTSDALWESDSAADFSLGRKGHTQTLSLDDEEELSLAPKETLEEIAFAL